MALRFGQMILAVFGMWLILSRGLVRHPGWGEIPTFGQAPHWTVTMAPLAGGIICIGMALGLIWARNRA